MQLKHTFNKKERLKSRKLIESLFTNGYLIYNYPFKVLYKFAGELNFQYPAKIAVSVSKKKFKKAVDRNYIKRKIRETFRKNKQYLYEGLNKNDQKIYFIVIYSTNKDLNYKLLAGKMEILLKMLLNDIEMKQNTNVE